MEKTKSLRMNYRFGRVYRKGRHVAGRYVVLYTAENRLKINRLGITVSKKVGKSVQRNRIRRLVRESYRLIEDRLKTGYDLVFVARAAGRIPSFKEVDKEIHYLLGKAGVIEEREQ